MIAVKRRRKKKRNPSGFWSWASEHWIISGFILFPALLAIPVGIARAIARPKEDRLLVTGTPPGAQ